MQLKEPFRFDIKPIRDDRDHADALRAIEALWDAEPGSPEFDHMDVLVTLVEAYETRRWPIVELDPIAAIEAEMVCFPPRSRHDLRSDQHPFQPPPTPTKPRPS